MPRILFILQLPWPAVHACPVLCKCLLTTTTHHLVHACAVVAVNSADTVTCKINIKSCIAFLWNHQPLINALNAADMWTHMTSFIVVFLTECASGKIASAFSFKMQQATVQCDCQATKNLAEMAAEMPKLKAFVHVSTAYVNGNQPKGASISEHLLPLDGEGADHASLVTQLQTLPKAQAASQVSCSHHRQA